MIWTTLDSVPILPEAVKMASDIKNFYTWASFAEKEMNKLGHNHVKTLHGAIDTDSFCRLNDEKKKKIRAKNGINKEFLSLIHISEPTRPY